MDVFLDDQPFGMETTPETTVGQVLDQVLQHVRSQGRVVSSIRCDGVEISGEELDQTLAKPANDYARIDLVSGTAGDLAVDALGRVQAMLMELRPNREEAVEKLNQGQTSEAMEILSPYFEAWRQCHEAVLQSAKLLNLDLTTITVDDVPLAEMFADFAEQLRQLKEAFEANDHVTVSDIMNYEAEKTTERWIELIDTVKERARSS